MPNQLGGIENGIGSVISGGSSDTTGWYLETDLVAHSGKYRIDGNKITTRDDMSSNEVYTGANQDQTRFFRVEGDKLDIRTPEIASAVLPGKKIVGTLCFERER